MPNDCKICPCQCGFGTDFDEILQGVTATISGFGIERGIEFLFSFSRSEVV